MRSAPLYRIADYSIDLASRVIRHGAVAVEVEAKVFDLIALLLEHRERELSKREINEALWGQRPVTDAALSQLLSKARRALGDDGDLQGVIRTVHGHGLQWVAEILIDVEEEPAHAMPAKQFPAQSSRSWWPAALAALIAIAAALLTTGHAPNAGDGRSLPRIAILPIANNTGEADLAWTRNGLMGFVASLLQEQGRVEVIGSQTVQGLVGTRDTFDEPALALLGKSLGATHFVTGQLRRVGSLYELSVQLSTNGVEVHRDSLRGNAPTALAVDSVARLQRWLGVISPPAVDDAADIRNPFLAEAYARGLDASIHGDEANAKKYFQICLDQDPTLLWPRLRLAIAQGFTDEADAGIANARQVASAARARGDHDLLVLALRQLSAAAYFKGEGDAAAAFLDEALRLLPNVRQPLTLAGLHSTYGAVEIKRGRLVQARQHLEQALPLTRSAGSRRNEASVLFNLAIVDGEQGRFADRLKRFGEAIDAARECGSSDIEMRALGGLAAAEYDAGHALTAVPMLKQALALAQAQSDLQTQVHVGANLARTLAAFDRYDSANALVQNALEIGQRQANSTWQAKAQWSRGIVAEHRAAWGDALTALNEAHRLFAAAHSSLDDAVVLTDIARVATRGTDRAAVRAAATALAALIETDRGNPALGIEQPLVTLQLQHVDGHQAQATAALARLVEADTLAGPARLDALLQLGRWQIDQGDARAALMLMPALSTWLEQQPEAIELRIAALRSSGDLDQARREQARLDHLKASSDLIVEPALLASTALPNRTPPPK